MNDIVMKQCVMLDHRIPATGAVAANFMLPIVEHTGDMDVPDGSASLS